MSSAGRQPASRPDEPASRPDEPARRVPTRSGLTRVELIVTVFVVILAIGGIAALVPTSGGSSTGAGSSVGSASKTTKLDDAELAGPRAAAALAPCPTEPPAAAVPAAAQPAPAQPAPKPGSLGAPNALAGIEVPCLGAPGSVRPAVALAGQETLLNVWASWCQPCREELPALEQYAARPDAIPVLAIDVRDNPVQALKLLAELDIHLPTLADSGDALADALRIVALPASYLMRPDGSVVQLMPQVVYTDAQEIADAVANTRKGGP